MERQIPQQDAFKVETPISVRWSDMDAIGHVNNARYFTYCEMANFTWFDVVAPGQSMDEVPAFPVLAHMECDFMRSIVYPAKVRVLTRAIRVGHSSIVLQYLICDEDNEASPFALAQGTLVFIDRQTHHSCPIPADVREKIRELDGI